MYPAQLATFSGGRAALELPARSYTVGNGQAEITLQCSSNYEDKAGSVRNRSCLVSWGL